MIAVVRRVFVTDHFTIEAQHRASGPLHSICDRWSGLLVVIYPFRYTTWRSKLSSVQVRNLTSATNSGRTQCTRLSTSGDPKRLVRGGGTRGVPSCDDTRRI
jgi:hypothetical protein